MPPPLVVPCPNETLSILTQAALLPTQKAIFEAEATVPVSVNVSVNVCAVVVRL